MNKVLAVLATCVLALLGAQVARADADFTDPAGDASGAPDVVDVSVFNDAFNRIVFAAKIDGHFGAITEAAVKGFQELNDLSPDGIVGLMTWRALQASDVKAGVGSRTLQPA